MNALPQFRAETLDQFVEAFAPAGFRREAFYPCYGLAEATLLVSGSVREEVPIVERFSARALEQGRAAPTEEASDARPLVGCGKSPPGSEIAIVDPQTFRRCEDGRVGEIWIRGPSVAQGYWNRPADTERTFRARLADDGDGPFLRSGDLGFLRAGELFVTGRLKDLIIIRGRNHYPEELELTAEKSHPALRPGGCAAFSVEGNGEEQLVILAELDRRAVPTGNGAPALDVGQIQARIRENIAEHHQLRAHAIVVVASGALPKTSSGKLQRHVCRKLFQEGGLVPVAASA